MSIKVAIEELTAAIAERGSTAYLVTVGDSGPRVVSVAVRVRADSALVVGAGRHTAVNVAARPSVTVFWPVDADHPKHALLVDGTAVISPAGSEDLVITPTSAMLHRVREGRGTPSRDEENGSTNG